MVRADADLSDVLVLACGIPKADNATECNELALD
jgi:hypothetical protein